MTPVHLPALEPRVRFELTYPDYRSGASPPMLTGLGILEPMERIERSSVAYHPTALPLSYIGWSQRGYWKPRPPLYECGAPPLELLRRNGASAENRTPFVGQAIRCPTNGPHPLNFGADGDNRNLFSGLEAQGTPYIPRPHKSIFNCQRTNWAVPTHFDPPASNGK